MPFYLVKKFKDFRLKVSLLFCLFSFLLILPQGLQAEVLGKVVKIDKTNMLLTIDAGRKQGIRQGKDMCIYSLDLSTTLFCSSVLTASAEQSTVLYSAKFANQIFVGSSIGLDETPPKALNVPAAVAITTKKPKKIAKNTAKAKKKESFPQKSPASSPASSSASSSASSLAPTVAFPITSPTLSPAVTSSITTKLAETQKPADKQDLPLKQEKPDRIEKKTDDVVKKTPSQDKKEEVPIESQDEKPDEPSKIQSSPKKQNKKEESFFSSVICFLGDVCDTLSLPEKDYGISLRLSLVMPSKSHMTYDSIAYKDSAQGTPTETVWSQKETMKLPFKQGFSIGLESRKWPSAIFPSNNFGLLLQLRYFPGHETRSTSDFDPNNEALYTKTRIIARSYAFSADYLWFFINIPCFKWNVAGGLDYDRTSVDLKLTYFEEDYGQTATFIDALSKVNIISARLSTEVGFDLRAFRLGIGIVVLKPLLNLMPSYEFSGGLPSTVVSTKDVESDTKDALAHRPSTIGMQTVATLTFPAF